MKEYEFKFDDAKNEWLKENRDVGFDDILPKLEAGDVIAVLDEHNPAKYPRQPAAIIEYQNECYVVPFVYEPDGKSIFLKTLYPSRKHRKKFLKPD